MQVANNAVVSIHYTLLGEDGIEIESSRGIRTAGGGPGRPWRHHPGPRKGACSGHSVGDRLEVDVEPADAYGPRGKGISSAFRKSIFAMRRVCDRA